MMQPCIWSNTCSTLLQSHGLFLCDRIHLQITCKLPKSTTLNDRILIEALRQHAGPGLYGLKVMHTEERRIILRGEAHTGDKGDSDAEDVRNKCKGIIAVKRNSTGDTVNITVSAERVPPPFPTRHDWDSFFRDRPDMDEMKPGERPDTLHVTGLPVAWFQGDKGDGVRESVVKRAFEKFGKIRSVDVPASDVYRMRMKEEIRGLTKATSQIYFEAYVQYSEYSYFVKAMDGFRGKKLLRKEADGTCWSAIIDVEFDKNKHLSEASIRRRGIVRERLRNKAKNERDKKKREASAERKKREHDRQKKVDTERERMQKTLEKENRRKEKQLAKLKKKESVEINSKIAEEKKKLIRTQRRLQSIRLIEELFERIQMKDELNVDEYVTSDGRNKSGKRKVPIDTKKELRELEKALLLENKEKMYRERLVYKYKTIQEKELFLQRQKLQEALKGNIILKSVLDDNEKSRAPSISSLSSGSDIEIKDGKNIKPERDVKTFPNRDENTQWGGQPNMNGFIPYGAYPGYQPGYFPRFFPYSENYRGRGFTRRQRGGSYPSRRGRIPYFDGPNANRAYLEYFKKLTDDRRSRSRSYSRGRRRSYSSSRSRSYSKSRSRSRSRRRSSSRHRDRYSRSRSRHSRSRSRSRSKSNSQKRSRTRKSRSKSRSRSRRRSRTKSRSREKSYDKSSKTDDTQPKKSSKKVTSTDFIPVPVLKLSTKTNEKVIDDDKSERRRSKSWSLPKESSEKRKSWSKSPVKEK